MEEIKKNEIQFNRIEKMNENKSKVKDKSSSITKE